MIRVLIADDHPIVRAGLRAVLELQADLEVVEEESTAQKAVRRVGRGDVDVVLMDLQFGDRPDGIEATRQIRALPDPPEVIVLTTYDIEGDVLFAIEAGLPATCSRTPGPRSWRRRSGPPGRGTPYLPAASPGGWCVVPSSRPRH